ncbi:hypothetical protein [Streptomyces sp. SLBN-115]|uniref:hypothetical protein n=1 Tax=Streptomyces sp. SLBN-115 TaxID=2768453 RepID=UPI001359945F|nr:hypothetical protein [Streptomyces sp. SLBN-115]
MIGAVTGATTSPSTLLLGPSDASGRLRLVARTTPLPTAARRDLGTRLRPADTDHPWRGRRFSTGWGNRGELEFNPVHPNVVVEFLADTAVDDGRYRHPDRFLRMRAGLTGTDVPLFGERENSAGR